MPQHLMPCAEGTVNRASCDNGIALLSAAVVFRATVVLPPTDPSRSQLPTVRDRHYRQSQTFRDAHASDNPNTTAVTELTRDKKHTHLHAQGAVDVTGLALNRYPDPLQLDVKNLLAEMRGVRPEQIFVGVGSDEAIDLLMRIFCRPGEDSILLTPPTYGMYKVMGASDINEWRSKSCSSFACFCIRMTCTLTAWWGWGLGFSGRRRNWVQSRVMPHSMFPVVRF